MLLGELPERGGWAEFCVGDIGNTERPKQVKHHPEGSFVRGTRADIFKELFGCQTKQMRHQYKCPS